MMLSIVVFVCVVYFAIAVVGWCSRRTRFNELLDKIPGPPPLPVLGNCLDLWGGLDHFYNITQKEWPAKYGEIFHAALGSQHFVAISSPELIETILKSPTCIDKGDNYGMLENWLGNGLLLSTGAKWKVRRKLLTPAFHYQILSNFMETFHEKSVILCNILKDLCPVGEKREIDIAPLATRCSLDIICECAMGIHFNAQLEDSEYVKAIDRITQIVVERFKQPWLISDAVFALSPLGREQKRLLKTVHDFTDLVICKRREQLDREKALETSTEVASGFRNRRPFLDLLLQARVNGKEMSQEDIREEVDTFMFEGHDTVAAAVCWFIYCMAVNPQQQEKVCLELEEVFGGSDRECKQQDLTRLKYLECCIKEAMRLYPSVSVITRILTDDMQLGDFLVPAGSNVGVLISATHHNPRIYPKPLTFDPDRFLLEEIASRHPFAYIPFSAGPRNCIGQRFALMEEKAVLANLLRQFRFELTSEKPVPSMQIILKSLSGFKLLISRR